MNGFIRDIVSAFRISSPTIIYDGDEAPPDICYTDQRVLCLPIHESDQDVLSVSADQVNAGKVQCHCYEFNIPTQFPLDELMTHGELLFTENCLTISGPEPGKKCEFPHTHLNQQKYNACTMDIPLERNNKPWCNVKLDGNFSKEDKMMRKDISWGDCGPMCPFPCEF